MNVKKGPWTITNSKIVYKNPWLSVKEDSVIRPDGKKGIFGVVELKLGVAVLPIGSDNNVYLTKEYHYAIGQETIEVISGGIDNSEDKNRAAKRELKEESGIEANELIYLGKIRPLTSIVLNTNYLFIAKGLKFSDAIPESTEIIKIVKMPLKKAIELVYNGTINDGTSVVLILKAKNHLGL